MISNAINEFNISSIWLYIFLYIHGNVMYICISKICVSKSYKFFNFSSFLTLEYLSIFISFTEYTYILLDIKRLMIFRCLLREEMGKEKKEREERRRKDKGTDDVFTLISNSKQQTRKKLIFHLIHGEWYPEKCISRLLAVKMGKRPRCIRESRNSFAASADFAASVLNSVSETFKEIWGLLAALLDWI